MAHTALSPSNQFSFVCPIFDVETKISACIKLRELVWKGQRPEVRVGCQACMSASKCPAATIVQRMAIGNRLAPDEYFSAQPSKGKLRVDILEHIQPVIVLENTDAAKVENTIAQYGVPSAEANLIRSSSERIAKQLGVAPQAKPLGQSKARKFVEVEKTAPKSTPQINTAAATGDLSAAINRQAQ